MSDAYRLLVVLRHHINDELAVFNASGEFRATIYDADIKAIRKQKGEVTLRLHEQTKEPVQRPLVEVYMSFLHSRMAASSAIMNATEAGASAIRGILCERTQSSLSTRKINTKEQWHTWAKEATQQCDRLDLPEIGWENDISIPLDTLTTQSKVDHLICCMERSDAKPLGDIGRTLTGSVGLIIGPEGGFSPKERTTFESWGSRLIMASLGPHILRSENAVTAACSIVHDAYARRDP